jgi:hypothetical protein
MNQGFSGHKATAQLDFLTMTAENTGGHAIINTNDFEPGIAEAFEENESYYLIGFEPTNTAADGKLRRLEVKVDRPDVEVRTRSSYYAPEPPKPDKKANAKNAPTPEAAALAKAMSGILPMAGMPMRVSVAPFAVPGQRLSTVTIVLGIRQPIPAAAAKDRVTETTELLTSAFTPEGDARGTQKHTARVVLRAAQTVKLPTGARAHRPASSRYQLRLARMAGPAAVTAASLRMSRWLLERRSRRRPSGRHAGPRFGAKDLLASLLPFMPTAGQDFARADDWRRSCVAKRTKWWAGPGVDSRSDSESGQLQPDADDCRRSIHSG